MGEYNTLLLVLYMQALVGSEDLKKVVEEWDDRWDYARKPEEWIPALNIVMMIIKRSKEGERWEYALCMLPGGFWTRGCARTKR